MVDITDWSATAGSNADVDGVNVAEGCDPGDVNNAMRAIMAGVAALRDNIGGANVSAGTADVQTLTTGLSLAAYQQGVLIAFEAGAGLTNTGACTLNIDGIGAKSVKTLAGADPVAGVITAGGIYIVAYESGADVLLLLTPAVSATTLGLGTGDSPQLTAVNIGHATDTTLARVSAGVVSIEGVTISTASNTLTLTNKTLTDPQMVGTIKEDCYVITDGAAFAIDPRNGSVQRVTLGASRTPTAANWADGDAVTLKIADGMAYAITWTTVSVTWIGGSAPALAATGWTWVELWRENSTIYGKHAGDSA